MLSTQLDWFLKQKQMLESHVGGQHYVQNEPVIEESDAAMDEDPQIEEPSPIFQPEVVGDLDSGVGGFMD